MEENETEWSTGSSAEQSEAKDNETQQSGVFGSGAMRRIVKCSGAECFKAERSRAEENETKRSGVFGGKAERSGAKRRIMKRSRAECFEAKQSGG